MLVLIGLAISTIVALVIAKILNRKFFMIWLCVFITMGAIVISISVTGAIIISGITNKSMLYLIEAVLCWVASVIVWRDEI